MRLIRTSQSTQCLSNTKANYFTLYRWKKKMVGLYGENLAENRNTEYV